MGLTPTMCHSGLWAGRGGGTFCFSCHAQCKCHLLREPSLITLASRPHCCPLLGLGDGCEGLHPRPEPPLPRGLTPRPLPFTPLLSLLLFAVFLAHLLHFKLHFPY